MAIKIKNQSPPKLSEDRLLSIESEMDSLGLAVRMAYDEMIADGMYPVLAATLSAGKFANIGTTDSTFNKREHYRMAGMEESQRENIAAIARKHGISTQGKTYNGALGRYSDPKAWVSGTHDVVTAANEKGLSVRGMVNVENEQQPITKKKIASDILDRLERQKIASDPVLQEKVKKKPGVRKEIRAQLTEKHAS